MGIRTAICVLATPIYDSFGRRTANAQWSNGTVGISLSPSERAVCAQLGISEGDFIAQRRDPIFGTALHNTNGPFGGKRAKSPFPDAPDAQINPPHPADQRAPYSAGRPEDMEGDDDEEDDVSRRLGLGTRRRGVRVKFPPRTQV